MLQAVRDIAAREATRRAEATQDLTKHLPTDILAILITMDEQEATQVQARDDAHQRFVTLIEKFLAKFVTELNKYKERMDELAVSVEHFGFYKTINKPSLHYITTNLEVY